MTQNSEKMNDDGRYSLWFVVLVAVFITSLISANIISVKLIGVLGLVLPAGVIIFQVSYITGDVLTEVYGYSQARKVIWLGFFCNLLAVVDELSRYWYQPDLNRAYPRW
jgi:uncharacterized PurR-regulated membrane protein YhhQ (DUF165 family)